MRHVIIGTEAVATGTVTSHELRRWYRPIFPNVHAPVDRELTLRDRTIGAWLYCKREGIVTGLAAAALHGSLWVDDAVDIELIFKCSRSPAGLVARNERIAPDEYRDLDGLPVATPERTAFDLGRFRPDYEALARLDALMRFRPFEIDDIMVLADRYKGARGVARLKALLPYVDGGAESPRESWWRKLLIDAGFPTPATQIPVVDEDGVHVRTLDLGWESFKVGLEYDGDQHQSDRLQYLKDRRVLPELRRLNWHVTSVVKEDDPVLVINRLNAAMRSRGWRGAVQIPSYAYAYARRLTEIAHSVPASA
ncbi:hypothetical protein ACTWP6_10860 [Mycobacterium sp. 4D054]|uniref:hypothetical protein n=1 Tax=Mycobacterium sp. 4D054 TaxID=3457440 RepID=UPI003FD338D0